MKDGCSTCPDPWNGGDLSLGAERRGQQEPNLGHLSRIPSPAVSAPARLESEETASGAVLPIWRGKSEWTATGRRVSELALYCGG